MSPQGLAHDLTNFNLFSARCLGPRAYWDVPRFICVWPARGAYLFAKAWPVLWTDGGG